VSVAKSSTRRALCHRLVAQMWLEWRKARDMQHSQGLLTSD
jgi:hypothetical protein